MRKNATSVVLALGVHAGVVATLAAVGPREIQPPAPVAEATEVAVEPIDTEPSRTPLDSTATAAIPSSTVAAAVAAAMPHTQGRRESTQTAPEGSAEPSPTPDATWSLWSAMPAPPMNLTLPLAGAASAVRDERSPAAPGPAPASTTGGLREGLAAHDHELGLGPGGPVVGVAESATRASVAPIEGFALFEVRFDETGAVHDVHVVDAKSERDSWTDVASGIAAGLKATRIRVPNGARGVSVKVRVESAWLNADGSRPQAMAVCVPPVPCSPDPKVRRIVITPLTIAGNIVPDAPVAPSRHVHARIVEERAY
jgi:hypothetical protein